MKLLLVLALVIQATIIYSATVQDDGVYKIIPKGSWRVLGIQDNSNAVGADLVAQPDQGSNYQRFRMHQESPNIFYIENLGSGLYISNFALPPRQATFNPNAYYQDYEFIPVAGGYYMIRPTANQNNVLTLAGDGSLSWQPIIGADNQFFFLCRATSTSTSTFKAAALTSSDLSAENVEGLDLRP